MGNLTRRTSVWLLLFLAASCTKDAQSLQDQVEEAPVPKPTIEVEKETYDGASLEDLIFALQKNRVSRIIYYFHDDGNISPVGAINILSDVPEFFSAPNSGEMRKYDLLSYNSNKLEMDIILFWTGAEEISPGERKTVGKLKVILTADEARKALIDSHKELVIPAVRVSSLDVGPLSRPWDGSFIVKKPIEALSSTLDGMETIEAHIDVGSKVVLLNYSDDEVFLNGVNQYILQIQSGEKVGWVPEEYIAFREP